MSTAREALVRLAAYRETVATRDEIVRTAHAAGINIRRIGLESGISRATIYQILGREETNPWTGAQSSGGTQVAERSTRSRRGGAAKRSTPLSASTLALSRNCGR